MSHKVQIVGNLGRDPEMRYTPSGQAVTNFSVESTRKWKDAQGQEVKETVWVRVATWGKMAEVVNNTLSKGDKVEVWGRFTPDTNGGPKVFTKQDGTASASYEIKSTEVNFLNVAKWANGNGAQAQVGNYQPAPAPNAFPQNYGQAQGQSVQGQQPVYPQGQQPVQGHPQYPPQGQQPVQQQGQQGW